MIPEDLHYTDQHEWVAPPRDVAYGSVSPTSPRTRWATSSTSSLPEPGTTVEAGESLGEVESTKSVSEIYAPLSGTVHRA